MKPAPVFGHKTAGLSCNSPDWGNRKQRDARAELWMIRTVRVRSGGILDAPINEQGFQGVQHPCESVVDASHATPSTSHTRPAAIDEDGTGLASCPRPAYWFPNFQYVHTIWYGRKLKTGPRVHAKPLRPCQLRLLTWFLSWEVGKIGAAWSPSRPWSHATCLLGWSHAGVEITSGIFSSQGEGKFTIGLSGSNSMGFIRVCGIFKLRASLMSIYSD